MKALFIITMMFFANTAYSKVNCEQHGLYCAIIELNSNINKSFAMKLSNEIYKGSRKYKVDPYRVIAIMRQESGINMNARNTSSSTKTHVECDDWEACVTTKVITTETTDFGLFQFHIYTMKRNKLDVNRVMTDMKFTVDYAIKMINRKIKMCASLWPKTPWACYNSATKKHHKTYVKLVNRYYLGSNN